jgi:hypothetical protein
LGRLLLGDTLGRRRPAAPPRRGAIGAFQTLVRRG